MFYGVLIPFYENVADLEWGVAAAIKSKSAYALISWHSTNMSWVIVKMHMQCPTCEFLMNEILKWCSLYGKYPHE